MEKNLKYQPADKFIDYNTDDEDLKPIRIFLPAPPKPRYIANYGKEPEDQKFERNRMPGRLMELEEQAKREIMREVDSDKSKRVSGQAILERYWKLLNENKKLYSEEINWIKKQLYFIEYGYWVYINGKPTYINGWHYEYLTFFHLDVGRPEYRDKDRKWFVFAWYCYTTTHDEKWKDTGSRTCYGFNYPKSRRDGATYRSMCIALNLARNNIESDLGIQSFDKVNAGEHFTGKLIPAWQKYPLFLKPVWSGSFTPRQVLDYKSPANKPTDSSLGTKITYASTASRKFYDGWKLLYYLGDEEGKTVLENIRERWDTVKETLSLGAGSEIHGFSIHPSTVADMKEKGGENYYDLCEDSKFYERDELSKQTTTGLFRLFFPAYEGLKGFIGPYGESVVEKPTPEQAKFIGKNYGAKEYILSRRDSFLADGSPEAMRNYYSFIELYPIKYAECFRVTDGDIGFNIEILDKRIAELRRWKDAVVRGNFKRIVDGVAMTSMEIVEKIYAHGRTANITGEVRWFADPKGRWNLSKKLEDNEAGKKERNADMNWMPAVPHKYITSADPFRFNKKSEVDMRKDRNAMSDGGIATLWERDYGIDPEGKPIQEWESNRFVCTYRFRPSGDDEFAEDVLMQCEYFGSELYPEMNIELLWKHFLLRGYGGYLRYDIRNGKRRTRPGFDSLERSKQELFSLIRTHIQNRGESERHIDLLIECKKIGSVENMTKFDLFAAAGGALLGSANLRKPELTPRIDPRTILAMFGEPRSI